MRRAPHLTLAFALALAGTSAGAQAPSAKPRPSKAQLENASANLKIMLSAFQSDKVEAPVKDALFGCLYENSISKVTEATEKVIATNPGKIDRKNPNQMLGVIAGVCGYRPKAPPKPR